MRKLWRGRLRGLRFRMGRFRGCLVLLWGFVLSKSGNRGLRCTESLDGKVRMYCPSNTKRGIGGKAKQ